MALRGLLVVFFLIKVASPTSAQAPFRRGDANIDGKVDVSDAVLYEFRKWMFDPGESPRCMEACNFDGDDTVKFTDILFLLDYLFHLWGQGGLMPPDPGPFDPGPDPTSEIGCISYDPKPGPKLADLTLGFECPGDVPLKSDGPTRFQVFATLGTANNTTQPQVGAEAWSISLGAENLKILSITTEGTIVPEFPQSAHPLSFSETVDPLLDTGSGPQGEGAVSVVLLQMLFSTPDTNLAPAGTVRIAAITLEAPDPAIASTSGRVFFVDGKKGSGLPVPNVISILGTSQTPELGSCEIPLIRGGLQHPGDANQDGGLNLSDAIWLLNHLFLGTPGTEKLPCEGGTAGEPGPGEAALLDWNDDRNINISDVIGVLSWLFIGGDPHPLGAACVSVAGCPDNPAPCGR